MLVTSRIHDDTNSTPSGFHPLSFPSQSLNTCVFSFGHLATTRIDRIMEAPHPIMDESLHISPCSPAWRN
jgi:hypothetical protein